ncbi:MAG: hypothetical protein K6G26_13465 [Lachnospiraceae bacterium]|nr:hypothetical protein [Lachnospiraceae bacterium]
MTKKKQTKTKVTYRQVLSQLYAWLSVACFALVILTPIWKYNIDTMNASVYTAVAWFAAVMSNKMDK